MPMYNVTGNIWAYLFIIALGAIIKTLFANSVYVKCYFKITLVSIFLIIKES